MITRIGGLDSEGRLGGWKEELGGRNRVEEIGRDLEYGKKFKEIVRDFVGEVSSN